MLWGQGAKRDNDFKGKNYLRQILGFVLLPLLVEASTNYFIFSVSIPFNV